MIISHKHKFIFIHTRKTAGSTITVYLNKYLGPNDLQIGAWGESIKNGNKYNKRFIKDFFSINGIKGLLYTFLSKVIFNKKFTLGLGYKHIYKNKLSKARAHPNAKELIQFAPFEFENYFTFCFVRNPYDRAVSEYKWITKNIKGVSFLEYLERLNNPKRPDKEKIIPLNKNSWEFYTINNQVVVDFIGKFENLEKDFEKICKKIGIPFDKNKLPKAKVSKKGKNFSYRNWYGKREKELVEKIYEKELKYFNYKF
ncbi:MAG: sulfotransferase family 2 domain-containing protein [archaeon]